MRNMTTEMIALSIGLFGNLQQAAATAKVLSG
jgi:hypothetical protein